MAIFLWGTAQARAIEPARLARSRQAGYAAGLLAWLIAASAFIVVKGVSREMPPWTMGFFRVLIISLIILPLMGRYRARMIALLRARWAEILLIGALGLGLTQGVIYTALHLASAVNVGIVFGMSPMVTLLLARLVLGEPLNVWQAIGSALAFCGILTISVQGDFELLRQLRFGSGELAAFCAMLLFASYTVLLKRARFDVPPLPLLSLLLLGGALAQLPFFVWEYASGLHENLGLNGMLGLLYIAVVGGGVMYLAYNWSIEVLGAAQAGTLVYTQMVFVTIFAWIFLGERLEPYHYAAGALIAAGVFLVVRLRPTRSPQPGSSG